MKCDFCGYVFSECNGVVGCSGCPMAKSCGKVKCPNCSYEICREPHFRILNSLRNWVKKKAGPALHNEDLHLNMLKSGESGKVLKVRGQENSIIRKLAAFGIFPGVDVTVIQKYPAVLVQVGYTQLALDGDIAAQILVNRR